MIKENNYNSHNEPLHVFKLKSKETDKNIIKN